MRLDGLDEDDARRQYTEFFSARYDVARRAAFVMCGDWHRADDPCASWGIVDTWLT